jgi:hypothetical protein
MLALRVNYANCELASGDFPKAIRNQPHELFAAFSRGGGAFWRKKASK